MDLAEIERRRLYSKYGASSLHEFCIRVLGYSEGAAHRRISAMRCMVSVPEVKEKLETGTLNLTTVSLAHSFFQNKKKINRKIYSKEEKKDVLTKLAGKSKLESLKVLASLSPESVKQPEMIKPISATETRITLTLDEGTLSKLRKLQDLHSHKLKTRELAELIKLLATNSLETEEKKKVPKEMPTSLARSPSRHVPVSLKRQVWMRDKGQCTYPGCQSRHRLEIDHCEPFSMGGETEINNLRLLCKAHNAYQAIQTFGLPKMSQYLSPS